jgi:hypothetical protein
MIYFFQSAEGSLDSNGCSGLRIQIVKGGGDGNMAAWQQMTNDKRHHRISKRRNERNEKSSQIKRFRGR